MNDKILLISDPIEHCPNRKLMEDNTLLSYIDCFVFKEQLRDLLGRDGQRKCQWTFLDNRQEFILNGTVTQFFLINQYQILSHKGGEYIFFVTLDNPGGICTCNVLESLVGQFDFLYTGSQYSHFLDIQFDPADEVIEIALRKQDLYRLLIIIQTLKTVTNF